MFFRNLDCTNHFKAWYFASGQNEMAHIILEQLSKMLGKMFFSWSLAFKVKVQNSKVNYLNCFVRTTKCSYINFHFHYYIFWLLNKEIFFGLFLFFFFFVFSRAAPAAHGGFQARSLIGAVAAGLCQSHSNLGSELCLRSIPQLTATADP